MIHRFQHYLSILFFNGLLFFSLDLYSFNIRLIDTSTKKTKNIINFNEANNSLGNLYNYKEAIAAFKSDSIEKGVHLMAILIRRYDNEKNLLVGLNYKVQEIYNLTIEADNGDFSIGEKGWFINFISYQFKNKDKSYYKNQENILNKLPESIISLRLKLYLSSIYFFDNPTKIAKQILKKMPNNISANTFLADQFNEENKYTESNLYCDNLISSLPKYAHAYAIRADNYENLNETQKAIDDYAMAIKLFPFNYDYYYKQAVAYMDLDKYKEAIPGLLRTYYFNPSYSWTKYNLARSYMNINKLDSALYYINLHIEENSNDADGYNLKGELYYKKDEYNTAIDLYSQAILTDSTKAYYYTDRADAYFYDQKINEAIIDFKKSLKIKKTYLYSVDRLGDCYYDLKQYEQSISWYNQAIKINPKYKYSYIGLGLSKLKLNNFEGAIADCKTAIAIDSTYASAYGNLGWAYYCNGDNDNCIIYSYKAIKYDEESTYAMFNIALATLKQGKVDEAKTLYRNFITTCNQKGYKILPGAIDDIRDLINKNIAVEDCKFIIEHLFEKSL